MILKKQLIKITLILIKEIYITIYNNDGCHDTILCLAYNEEIPEGL